MGDAFLDDVDPDGYVIVVLETGSGFIEDAKRSDASLTDS